MSTKFYWLDKWKNEGFVIYAFDICIWHLHLTFAFDIFIWHFHLTFTFDICIWHLHLHLTFAFDSLHLHLKVYICTLEMWREIASQELTFENCRCTWPSKNGLSVVVVVVVVFVVVVVVVVVMVALVVVAQWMATSAQWMCFSWGPWPVPHVPSASQPQSLDGYQNHLKTQWSHVSDAGSCTLKFHFPFRFSGIVKRVAPTAFPSASRICNFWRQPSVTLVSLSLRGPQIWNSNHPPWLAVRSTDTWIFSPFLYSLVMIPFANVPPASWGKGPWGGSPQTPHFPPWLFWLEWPPQTPALSFQSAGFLNPNLKADPRLAGSMSRPWASEVWIHAASTMETRRKIEDAIMH